MSRFSSFNSRNEEVLEQFRPLQDSSTGSEKRGEQGEMSDKQPPYVFVTSTEMLISYYVFFELLTPLFQHHPSNSPFIFPTNYPNLIATELRLLPIFAKTTSSETTPVPGVPNQLHQNQQQLLHGFFLAKRCSRL